MDTLTKANVVIEEAALLQPVGPRSNPTRSRSIPRHTQRVPQSLMEFPGKLVQHLSHLPLEKVEILEDWITQVTTWSEEMLEILEDMHDITQQLIATRPADLRGGFSIEGISLAMDELLRIVRFLRSARTEYRAQIAKALDDIHNISMLQGFIMRR